MQNENEKRNDAASQRQNTTKNETNFADPVGNKTKNETKTWIDGWGRGSIGCGLLPGRTRGASVGLLKGPQKIQIQVLGLHCGFSIVDNTELPTRARAAARAW